MNISKVLKFAGSGNYTKAMVETLMNEGFLARNFFENESEVACNKINIIMEYMKATTFRMLTKDTSRGGVKFTPISPSYEPIKDIFTSSYLHFIDDAIVIIYEDEKDIFYSRLAEAIYKIDSKINRYTWSGPYVYAMREDIYKKLKSLFTGSKSMVIRLGNGVKEFKKAEAEAARERRKMYANKRAAMRFAISDMSKNNYCFDEYEDVDRVLELIGDKKVVYTVSTKQNVLPTFFNKDTGKIDYFVNAEESSLVMLKTLLGKGDYFFVNMNPAAAKYLDADNNEQFSQFHVVVEEAIRNKLVEVDFRKAIYFPRNFSYNNPGSFLTRIRFSEVAIAKQYFEEAADEFTKETDFYKNIIEVLSTTDAASKFFADIKNEMFCNSWFNNYLEAIDPELKIQHIEFEGSDFFANTLNDYPLLKSLEFSSYRADNYELHLRDIVDEDVRKLVVSRYRDVLEYVLSMDLLKKMKEAKSNKAE